MKARSVLLALILASVGLTASSFSQAKKATVPVKTGPADAFTKLSDEFFDQAYFKFNPTQGTAAGLHQYDPQLEDYSRAGVDKQIAALNSYKRKLEQVKSSTDVAVVEAIIDRNGKVQSAKLAKSDNPEHGRLAV